MADRHSIEKKRPYFPEGNTRSDRGITFVEVLIAMAITVFISLLVARVTLDGSKSLDLAASRTLNSQKVIKFTNHLKYDISGAFDVFVFGKYRPSDVTDFCSSNETGNQWDNISSSGFVRPLFSIRTVELDQDSTPMPAASNIWVNPVTNLVTYEIRLAPQKTTKTELEYELWRYECSGGSLDTPDTETKMLDLGGNLGNDSLTGLSALTCDQKTCPESSSTASASYYSFSLPYDSNNRSAGKFQALRILAKGTSEYMQSLSYLSRKVDN